MIKQWYARAIGGAFACSIALIAVAWFSLFASAQVPIDRATEKTAVEQVYRDYVAAFSADDDPRKAAAYCLEPTMLVGPRLVRVLNSTTETEKWIVEIRSSMRSRGVADVVIDQLNVKLLGQNIALLSATYRRRAKDGAVLDTAAGSYILRKSDQGWKIATVTPHPPEDFIKLD